MKRRTVRAALTIALFELLGCDTKPEPEESLVQASTPSPNASILPAPLASAGELVAEREKAGASPQVGLPVDSAGRLVVREPEPPPPEPMNVTEALPRDRLTTKDASVGLTLKTVWRWQDMPEPPKVPKLDAKGIRAASEATQPTMTVDFSYAGRMRIALDAPVFPLPPHTELRARTDRHGHVLVWPNGLSYRLLAPGSLRSLFAERRPDVTPLVRAKVSPGDPGTRHGLSTKTWKLATPTGKLTLEQAEVPGSNATGALLCRFLVELVGADPAIDACSGDVVPVGARYDWAAGGRIDLEVLELSNRQDLPLSYAVVPPPAATFKPGELPPSGAGVFLTMEQLRAFRTEPVELDAPPDPKAPGEGLTAVNHAETLRYLLLDGVPVAWVKPKASRYVIGPRKGRYGVSWRDFFGTAIEPQAIMALPARIEIGASPDGGE